MFAIVLDIVCVAALAGFAWFIWPPAVLLVIGLAAGLASYQRSPGLRRVRS